MCAGDLRDARASQRLNRPPATIVVSEAHLRRTRCRRHVHRHRRTGLHPVHEQLNFSGRQLTGRRHFIALITHRLNQQAVCRFARHQNRTGLTPREDGGRRIQSQTTFLLTAIVAFVTARRQQRSNLQFKMLDGRRSG